MACAVMVAASAAFSMVRMLRSPVIWSIRL